MWSERIITDDETLAGKPIIKGTRISVEFLLELLGAVWDLDEILKNYPQLTKEDVLAAIKYSAELLAMSGFEKNLKRALEQESNGEIVDFEEIKHMND